MQVETVPALAALTAAGLSETARDTIATRAITQLGDTIENIIEKASQASPDVLAGNPSLITDTVAYYQSAADSAVGAAIGAENVDDFYAWAKLNHGAEIKRAMVQQYHTHRTDAYAPLLERYLRQNEPSAAATRAAGLQTFGKGDELVTIDGITATRKALARAGLI